MSPMVEVEAKRNCDFFLAMDLVLVNSDGMNTKAADWRADLDASRDLNDMEKQHDGFLVSWFESWRVRQRLESGVGGRESGERF